MKLVVFGQSGQLAQALALMCKGADIQPTFLGRAQCDLTNAKQVADCLLELNPEAIINAAAYTAVEAAESQIAEAKALNTTAPQTLAELAKHLKVPFLHVSTDYVFDGGKAEPYLETDTPNPLNVYGRTKLEGERAVLAINPDGLIVRTSWVFSPFGHNFVRTMLNRAVLGEPLTVVDDQIGTPTSALDLAKACLRATEAKLAGHKAHGLFHYAASGETSWYRFAEEILKQTESWRNGTEVILKPTKSDLFRLQAARPQNSRLTSSAFVRQFKHPQPSWQESLEETLSLLETEFKAKWVAR